MNPPLISGQRPENMPELVRAYAQAPGVINRRLLPLEILRVPYAPTYNTKFILRRFRSQNDVLDEVTAMERARSALDSWMPWSHIVPDTYWKSEFPPAIAMEYIPGKNGGMVDMGIWTRGQRGGFVRQMAVIGICLIWGPRGPTSETTTKAMVGRGLEDKLTAAYRKGEIDELFNNNAPLGISAPLKPSLKKFGFLRPCDVSLRESQIVAITSWEWVGNRREREVGQVSENLSGLAGLDSAAPPGCGTLGDLD